MIFAIKKQKNRQLIRFLNFKKGIALPAKMVDTKVILVN